MTVHTSSPNALSNVCSHNIQAYRSSVKISSFKGIFDWQHDTDMQLMNFVTSSTHC